MTRARKTVGRITFVGCRPRRSRPAGRARRRGARAAPMSCTPMPRCPAVISALADGEVRPPEATPAETAKAAAGRGPQRARPSCAWSPVTRSPTTARSRRRSPSPAPSCRSTSCPGVPLGAGTAAYAGVPVGSVRTEADIAAADTSTSTRWPHAPRHAGADRAGRATSPTVGEQLVVERPQARHRRSPSAATARRPGSRPSAGTLGDARARRGRHDRHRGRHGRQGRRAARQAVVVGVASAVRLAGARAAHQGAGRRDERPAARATARCPVEVPTIAVEPPRTPTQMERAIKGLVTGRYEWIVFTSTNAVRAVREKFEEFGLDARAFAGVKIACVGEATADAVRAFGITPELVPSGEQSSEGLLADFPPYDDVLDPIDRVLLPRADIATETLAAGPARARLGDRRRHGVPDRARRAAGGRDPRRDQVRWLPGGVLHLVLDGAQPGRHRRQAARAHRRRVHRPADRRDRARVRAARRRPARARRRCPRWSTRWPSTRRPGPSRSGRRRPRRPPRRPFARLAERPADRPSPDRATSGRLRRPTVAQSAGDGVVVDLPGLQLRTASQCRARTTSSRDLPVRGSRNAAAGPTP